MEVLAHAQPRRLQDRLHHLLGGARIGGALQHHQLIGPQVLGDGLGGGGYVAQIWLASFGQRRGHAHDDGVTRAQLGEVRARAEAAARLDDALGLDVADVALPCPQLLHLRPVHIQPHHRLARLRHRQPQRQPHVPQPDHPHHRLLRGQLVLQFHFAFAAALRVSPNGVFMSHAGRNCSNAI